MLERQIIEPDNTDHWLSLRDGLITSTMSPALFGLSPYTTAFELWHSKSSGLRLPFKENERMQRGSRLQDACADEVALEQGWTVWRADEIVVIPELRLGSSFDYRIRDKDRGPGLLEVKCVDFFIYRDQWTADEAPPHIEIQLQHQLEIYDKYEWGAIAVFTSIFDHHVIFRDRDREMGAAIVEKTRQFWADVDAGREPDPDFGRDDEVIKALHKGGPALNATEDLELNALLTRYARQKEEKSESEKAFKATQAELLHRIGDHSEVFGRDFKLKVTQVKGSDGTLVTQDMLGSYIGARSGYPLCTLSDLHKAKRGKAA
jgi:putative phage-type endonuclease